MRNTWAFTCGFVCVGIRGSDFTAGAALEATKSPAKDLRAASAEAWGGDRIQSYA